MSASTSSSPIVKPAELPGRGRALVATRPINPGEILLSDSPLLLYPAYFSFAATTTTTSYCATCFRSFSAITSSSVLRCPSGCSPSSLFCSSRCLSSHSPFICHALSCLATAAIPPDLISPSLFLLAAYHLAFSSPADFNLLLSLHGSAATADALSVASLHSLLSSIFRSMPPGFSPELTAALLAKDKMNAFGLMEPFDGSEERRVRAYGIYPNASFFNHDCLPNACRFDYLDVDGDRNTDIVVRALHDIPEGREVCLSYFPVNWRYTERQKRLMEDYGFMCECDRCRVEKEWKDDDVEEDEGDGMEEEGEEDEEAQNMEEANNDGDDDQDFPHAYFFVRFLCDRESCGGTLAPLPPSPQGTPSTVMECNVCGWLRTEEDITKEGGDESDTAMAVE